MQLILKYLKLEKRFLVLALVLATVNNVFSLLDPQIFRLIVDRYATRAGELPGREFLTGVGALLLASVGVALVSRIAKNFQDYFVNVITQRVGARMYAESVSHSFSLPYAIFEDQRSGEVLLKFQKARADAQLLITSTVNVLFFSLVGVIFVLAYSFLVHWTIALAFGLAIPILAAVTYFTSRRIKAAQKVIVAETADLAGSTTETLRNVELVKSLGLETQETERLNRVNERILGLELKKVKLIRMLSFIQGTTLNALRSLILLLMLWLIFRQDITLGQFFSLLFYSFFVFGPLSELGNVAAQYQEAKASSEALGEILKIPPEKEPAAPQALGPLASVRLTNVSFQYGSAEIASVREMSMDIGQGETVALVGPSGSGKSTLVKLMVGLYSPSSGRILVNGTDLTIADKRELRRRIGYVSQETQLFAGTIRENLLFVNPAATDADCLNALRQAAALPIVERSGQGLDARIGEGGIKISGGERQRLAIARALLRAPELIIFDEATSSLDSLTEKEITDTIRDIARTRPNLMMVLVAHRLSTVAHADRIYVLEKGRLAEEGRHAELLARGGLYAALWREQSAEADIPPK